jgi:hypothetical protein
MLKKAVQQSRSERRGEEVRTALRVTVRPGNESWRTDKPLQYFEYARGFFNVEPLSDARTSLTDFFSTLLVAIRWISRTPIPTSRSMAHLGAGSVVSLRNKREANG